MKDIAWAGNGFTALWTWSPVGRFFYCRRREACREAAIEWTCA